MKSLENFVNHVRGNKYRLEALYEKLEWANHQLYSIPGPRYDRIGTPSNVQPNWIDVVLDRIWTLEHKIAEVEQSERLLHDFELRLTTKELNVFHLYFFKLLSQKKIATEMSITQQCVAQYLNKIKNKWKKHIEII